MDIEKMLGAFSKEEKRLIVKLINKEDARKPVIPTEVANFVNAGDMGAAAKRLALLERISLVDAQKVCVAYQKSLSLWRIRYATVLDKIGGVRTTRSVTKVLNWYGLNESVIRRRFKDSVSKSKPGTCFIEHIVLIPPEARQSYRLTS